ncbi:tetratricopeptide repeat protein [Risungbinella massiliensis]|uniref:tetratricopeptide repeat protein n=1 Tax=Risungbinella massiliensis TaxID=1329796 RepID=UPI0005CC8060|nr:tetratricopeptide repeat protein [Risungbinella massiliensis]
MVDEEIGKALRNYRKSRGLRLKDLADDQLSIATISSIERGIKVRKPKRDYYVKKLGIQNLAELSLNEQHDVNEVKQKLFLLASKIDSGLLDNVLPTFRTLQSQCETNKELLSEYYYLKGKYYFKKSNWNKTKSYLNTCIEICQKNKLFSTNFISCCYKELARVCFFEQNDIQKALEYVNEGLDYYDKDGERQDIRLYLIVGKASYLDKLNLIDESMHLLNEYWESFQEVPDLEVRLNAYEIKASILNKKGEYKKALDYVKEGFALSSINQRHRRSQELLTTWGNICFSLKDYKQAEELYLQSLELEPKTKARDLLVTSYTSLGILYSHLKQNEDASEYFNRALKEGASTKDAQRHCFALTKFADFLIKESKYFEAIISLEEARAIAVKIIFQTP